MPCYGKMNLIKRNYFQNLYQANKLLFLVVCLFSAFNLFFNLVYKSEITPVFQWSLYAYPIPDQQVYSIIEIRYNNNKLLTFPHTWQEPRKIMFTNTAGYFVNAKSNERHDYAKQHYINKWLPAHPFLASILKDFKIYNDEADLAKFPAWFKRYLAQETGEFIYNIDIYKINLSFEPGGYMKKISSELMYNIK